MYDDTKHAERQIRNWQCGMTSFGLSATFQSTAKGVLNAHHFIDCCLEVSCGVSWTKVRRRHSTAPTKSSCKALRHTLRCLWHCCSHFIPSFFAWPRNEHRQANVSSSFMHTHSMRIARQLYQQVPNNPAKWNIHA